MRTSHLLAASALAMMSAAAQAQTTNETTADPAPATEQPGAATDTAATAQAATEQPAPDAATAGDAGAATQTVTTSGDQLVLGAALQLQTASIPAEADAIVGRQITTLDGKEGGEVADVLITAGGQVEALLIKRGGALGLVGTQVAAPWSEVQLQGDQIVVNATRDQLGDMPEYQTE